MNEQNLFIPPHNTIPPETIAWFPPGWLLILCVVASLMIMVWSVVMVRRYRANYLFRRLALTQLDAIYTNGGTLQDANAVLKRLCLAYFPVSTASTSAQQWLDWLAQSLPPSKRGQFCEALQALQGEIYERDVSYAAEHHAALCLWCKQGLPKMHWLTGRLKLELV